MHYSDLTIKIKIAIGPFCGPCSDHIMPLGVTLGGRGPALQHSGLCR